MAAIREWLAPTKVIEIQSFLGLVNYYRRFIKGYSKVACPLTNLFEEREEVRMGCRVPSRVPKAQGCDHL